jgi:hypothetical protein
MPKYTKIQCTSELELDFDPLFLKIGINIPFPQLSDIIPLSNIILNNNT